MRQKGVIANIDGMNAESACKPSARQVWLYGCPSLCHRCPDQLEDFNVHNDTIYSSGAVVTGRICYDAFCSGQQEKGHLLSGNDLKDFHSGAGYGLRRSFV